MALLAHIAIPRLRLAAYLLLACAMIACRSRGFDVTIQNNAKVPLHNVEFDYAGGAFGTGQIAPGASYWYHIKPNADGELTLSFLEDNGRTFRQKGPTLHKGELGQIVVVLDQDDSKQWHMRVAQK